MKNCGIEHVAWDWNGTLFDDVVAALSAINAMLEKRRLPMLTIERYREIFDFPVVNCYRLLGFRFSTHEEWDRLATEFHYNYNNFSGSAGLTRGVTSVLSFLKEGKIDMSVLSASETVLLTRMLEEKKIRDLFANIYGSENLYGDSKILLGHRFIADTGMDPRRILLIGDTIHDFEVSQAIGCKCLLYLNGHQDRRRLEKCCCPLVDTFSVPAIAEVLSGQRS